MAPIHSYYSNAGEAVTHSGALQTKHTSPEEKKEAQDNNTKSHKLLLASLSRMPDVRSV